MNRFPRVKKILEILFISLLLCYLGYWIISVLTEKNNFEKLPTDVAQELETRLLGDWAMATEEGMMLIKFQKNSMSMANFATGKTDTKNISVIYNKLDNAWGIDLLSTYGVVEGKMMVVYKDQDTILFGAPGLPFVSLYRESMGSESFLSNQ